MTFLFFKHSEKDNVRLCELPTTPSLCWAINNTHKTISEIKTHSIFSQDTSCGGPKGVNNGKKFHYTYYYHTLPGVIVAGLKINFRYMRCMPFDAPPLGIATICDHGVHH